jgi:hypothetical protein
MVSAARIVSSSIRRADNHLDVGYDSAASEQNVPCAQFCNRAKTGNSGNSLAGAKLFSD